MFFNLVQARKFGMLLVGISCFMFVSSKNACMLTFSIVCLWYMILYIQNVFVLSVLSFDRVYQQSGKG